MKLHKIAAGLLLLTIVFFSFACTPLAANQVSSTYENDYYYFDIPEGDWITAPAGDMVSLILNNNDYLVNIVVETGETDLVLGEFVDEVKEDMETSKILINTTITQEGAATVTGENAYQIEFNYHLINAVEAKVFFLVKDGRYYTITYQTEEGYFNQHEAEFETMLNSFEIK
jgi:hypothetical protein